VQEEANQQEPGRALAEAEATCRRLAGIDFPWDITRALELALLKTFCVPSISGLLARTGEFETRPRKRYDDTGLMVAELLRHGVNSEAGAAVIARLNRIHGHYAISNDDFLYVLSTFVAEPIRWLARYGWRELSPQEQEHLFFFWQAVGERMGIEAIPGTLADLLALNTTVERGTYAYAPSNQRIAEATFTMLLADWPAPLRPLARQALMGLLQAEVAGSLGWPVPPGWMQSLVLRALRLRSQLSAGARSLARRLGREPPPRFYSQRPNPSYGETFQLEQLGPPPLLKGLNQPEP
jgi:hypothetical protein